MRKICFPNAFTLLHLLVAFPTIASEQAKEAEYLQNKYLEQNHFIKELAKPLKGHAEGVKKSLASNFSIHAKAEIRGTIEIATLVDGLRLKLASQKDSLYKQQEVDVQAKVQLATGRLEIYSPVDIDFWNMAALFVDHPEKNRPIGSNWKLKGYIVHTVEAHETVEARVRLLPLADDYMMLLRAVNGEATNIRIELQ